MMGNNKDIDIEVLSCGQERIGGDYKYSYRLYTEIEDRDVILDFCDRELCPCEQTYEEWDQENAASYYIGYYKLSKTLDGWKFSVFRPSIADYERSRYNDRQQQGISPLRSGEEKKDKRLP